MAQENESLDQKITSATRLRKIDWEGLVVGLGVVGMGAFMAETMQWVADIEKSSPHSTFMFYNTEGLRYLSRALEYVAIGSYSLGILKGVYCKKIEQKNIFQFDLVLSSI